MDKQRDATTHAYERILAIVFQRLSPTFGQRTIAAIAKNTLARQSRNHPILKALKVSEGQVEWAEFQARSAAAPEGEASAALEAFLDEFFEALSHLIGRLILNRLFREAEEQVKETEEEVEEG